jgi:protein-S-isoprenylcysteine O-methyltransferase Ste14
MTPAAPFRLLLSLPVPWVFVLGYLLGAAGQSVWPVRFPIDGSSSATLVAGLGVFILGAIIAGWGWLTFRRARTTTVPGEVSASLVTWGPYRVSRNPMYVGLSVAYVGEAIILRQVWPLATLPFVLGYVNWVVIPLEQRKLAEVFGSRYAEYQRRVRRWL